jgi:hypothetical protein
MAKEKEIRLIAYNIWEEENCPHGKDCEHWLRAETIWETQHKPKLVQQEYQNHQGKKKAPRNNP